MNTYIIDKTGPRSQPWVLYRLLKTTGTYAKLATYGSRREATNAAKLLAGWRGVVIQNA